MSGIIFMHRFFIPFSLREHLSLTQDSPIFHQISRVFRAKKWDTMIFFESWGLDEVYQIIDIDKRSIMFQRIHVLEKKLSWSTKKSWIKLFQALPNKISTLEILVQKIVEIGVEEIVLFPSERSQMRDISQQKILRINMIAQEAMEQCGGNVPLVIRSQESLESARNESRDIKHILAHPGWSRNLPESQNEVYTGLWVWPEWWWSEKEEAYFSKNDYSFWSFNDRILRLETAAIVGCGILLFWSHIS